MSADETTPLLPESRSRSDGEQNGNPNSLKDDRDGEGKERFALWMIGALCGVLLAYADTSLVWATHETVASSFNNLRNSSWMMTTFTIGYCVTLPLYGRLSDTYGRLRPLISAYATFSVGCSLCGLGQQYWQVILGRIITGCGASGIVSLASIIIADIAAPSNVAVLRSYVNIATVTGLSLGGPLGGVLSGTIGWKWSFLGQVPIAALCCLFIARGLRQNSTKPKDDERQLDEIIQDLKPSIVSFDFAGAITLAVWISSFLVVIDLQNQLSWRNPLVISITIAGALSFLAFIALETYPGRRELLIPMPLLKTEIGAFCLAQLLTISACHGLSSQLPPYFANSQGFSDAKAGAQTIPPSVGTAIGALLAGQLIKRFGRYKLISITCLVLYMINQLIILFQFSSHPISPWEGLTTLPLGIFGGLALSAQFFGLYSCTPKQYMATAISMYYMSQQIGIAMGITFSSTLLQHKFETDLRKRMAGIPGHLAIIARLLKDSSTMNFLPPSLVALIRNSYVKSYWVVPALATGAQILALVPSMITTEKYPT